MQQKMQEKLCRQHQNLPYSYIHLQQDETKLWCDECLLENGDKDGQVKVSNLILINKALSKPDFLITRFNLPNYLEAYLKDFQKCSQLQLENQIKEIEKQIEEIKTHLQLIFLDLKTKQDQLLKLRQNFQNEIQKVIKFDELQSIFSEFCAQETINPDIIHQIEESLHKYFQNLIKKNNQELTQQLTLIISDFEQTVRQNIGQFPLLEKLVNMNSNFFIKFSALMKVMGKNYNSMESGLIEFKFDQKLQQILMEKTKKKQINYSLIYKGSKDGFQSQQFWSKIQGKSNLLMIFKSQSNYIFGAYTPCQWDQNLNGYVQDGTNTSFLFSQTLDEVYPIKNTQQAIYCNSAFGPTFGGGHDLYINVNNFQEGYSQLGHSYQWNQYCQKKSSILFGSDKPNLIEMEIFQVILK